MDGNILKDVFELLPFTLYVDEELLKPHFVDKTPELTYKIDETIFNECHRKYYDSELVHFEVSNNEENEDELLDMPNAVCGKTENATSNSELTVKRVSKGVIINSKAYLNHHNWNTLLSMGGLFQCAVCDEILTCDDDHISSDSHKINLHLCRPLSEYGLSVVRKVENYYHCGVCNLMCEDISFHMTTDGHKINDILAIIKTSDKKPPNNVPEHKISRSVGRHVTESHSNKAPATNVPPNNSGSVVNYGNVINNAPAINTVQVRNLNVPSNNSGSVVKYNAPATNPVQVRNLNVPLPKLVNEILKPLHEANVPAKINRNLNKPSNLGIHAKNTASLQDFIRSFNKLKAPNLKVSNKVKPVPSLVKPSKAYYNENFPSLKGAVKNDVATDNNDTINEGNVPQNNTPDSPDNNPPDAFSYASAAKKPTVIIPEYLIKEFKNKTVKVKFDSWHMIITRRNKTFYCMACKEPNITDKWLHCCCVKHLESLQMCAIVEAFEDFFVREATDKFVHCGQCNNLQIRSDIYRHIAEAHPQAKKLITVPKQEINVKKLKQETSGPVKADVSTAKAKNVHTNVTRRRILSKRSSSPDSIKSDRSDPVRSTESPQIRCDSVRSTGSPQTRCDSVRSTGSPQTRCDSVRSTGSPQTRCDSVRSTGSSQTRCDSDRSTDSPQIRCDSARSTESSDSVRTTDSPDTRFISDNVKIPTDVFCSEIKIRPFDLELTISLLCYNTVYINVDKQMCCGLCDCLVHIDPVKHICGTWHMEMVRVSPFIPNYNNNLIREIKGRLHCALCNIYVAHENIFTHIMNNPHTVLLTKASGPVQIGAQPSSIFSSIPTFTQNMNAAPNPMWQSAPRFFGNQVVPMIGFGPQMVYPRPAFNPYFVQRVTSPIMPVPNMPTDLGVNTKTPENVEDSLKIVEINDVISNDDVNTANVKVPTNEISKEIKQEAPTVATTIHNAVNVDGASKEIEEDESTSKVNDIVEAENINVPTDTMSNQIEHLAPTVSTTDINNLHKVECTSKGIEKDVLISEIKHGAEVGNTDAVLNQIEHLVLTVPGTDANNPEIANSSSREISKDGSTSKMNYDMEAENTNAVSNLIEHLVPNIFTTDANDRKMVGDTSKEIEKDKSTSEINAVIEIENTNAVSNQIDRLVPTISTTDANNPEIVDCTSKEIKMDESISKINDYAEAENTYVPTNDMLNQINNLVPTVSPIDTNDAEKAEGKEIDKSESTSITNENIEAENAIVMSIPSMDNTLNKDVSVTNTETLDTNEFECVDSKIELIKDLTNDASSINESDLNEITSGLNEPYNMEEFIYLQFKNYNAKITFNSYNSLVPVGDGTRYCFVCWTQVNDLKEHVQSSKHLDNMKGIKYMEHYSDNMIRWKNSTHHCSVCNVMVFDNLQSHLSWRKHAAALLETRKTARQLMKDMKKTKYRQFKATFTKKKYICTNPVKLKFISCDNFFSSSI